MPGSGLQADRWGPEIGNRSGSMQLPLLDLQGQTFGVEMDCQTSPGPTEQPRADLRCSFWQGDAQLEDAVPEPEPPSRDGSHLR